MCRINSFILYTIIIFHTGIMLSSSKFNLYRQDKFNVTIDRMETVYLNKDLFEYFNVTIGRTTRKQLTMYGCTKLKVAVNKIMTHYTFKRKINNSHYLYTGIKSQLDAYDLVRRNIFGMRRILKEHGNVTIPLQAAVYCITNFTFDARKFPPLIPSGEYLVECYAYSNDVKAVGVRIYVTILYSQLYTGPQ